MNILNSFKNIFKNQRLQTLLISSLILTNLSCTTKYNYQNLKNSTQKLIAENKEMEAIKLYEAHINYRLKLDDKPEWENPYVYLLDIGDIYLNKGDVESALKYYLEAELKKVDVDYINDRLKKVAYWHEENQNFFKAIEHLKLYRDRDPLIFDLILDRISKKIITSNTAIN